MPNGAKNANFSAAQQRGQLAVVAKMGWRPDSPYTEENPLVWDIRHEDYWEF
jgi:hypothetical protein